MQVTTFASGSSGNCTLLQCGGTNILIDAGISMKRIKLCLAERGLLPSDISGVFITHEHTDHIKGLKTMTKQFSLPIFAPRTVANHICWSVPGADEVTQIINPGECLDLSGMSVSSFSTPHDTPQSVGYRFEGDISFGFCTDLGHISDEVYCALEGVQAAVLESNHDVDMLKAGAYPLFLKRRILSENGHLSNDTCARLAVNLAKSGLETLILAHISDENNTPGKAIRTVSATLESECPDCLPVVYVAPKTDILSVKAERGVRCSV